MNVHYALPNADLCANPSVAETVKLWDAGLEEAREAAIALGMNAASKKGGIIPDASWNAPCSAKPSMPKPWNRTKTRIKFFVGTFEKK